MTCGRESNLFNGFNFSCLYVSSQVLWFYVLRPPNKCLAFNPEKRIARRLFDMLSNKKKHRDITMRGWQNDWKKFKWPWSTAWNMNVKICAIADLTKLLQTHGFSLEGTLQTRGTHRLQIYSKIQIYSHIRESNGFRYKLYLKEILTRPSAVILLSFKPISL